MYKFNINLSSPYRLSTRRTWSGWRVSAALCGTHPILWWLRGTSLSTARSGYSDLRVSLFKVTCERILMQFGLLHRDSTNHPLRRTEVTSSIPPTRRSSRPWRTLQFSSIAWVSYLFFSLQSWQTDLNQQTVSLNVNCVIITSSVSLLPIVILILKVEGCSFVAFLTWIYNGSCLDFFPVLLNRPLEKPRHAAVCVVFWGLVFNYIWHCEQRVYRANYEKNKDKYTVTTDEPRYQLAKENNKMSQVNIPVVSIGLACFPCWYLQTRPADLWCMRSSPHGYNNTSNRRNIPLSVQAWCFSLSFCPTQATVICATQSRG